METTNDNISRILEMLDNPNAYTEQEIHDIINSDDETREAYRLMVAAKQGYRHKQAHQPADTEAAWKKFEQKTLSPLSREGESHDTRNQRTADSLHHRRGTRRASWVFRIAAIFIAAAFLGGLVFAAYRALSHRQTPTAQVSAPSLTERTGGESVRFTDIRLDSILTVVSSYYGREVCFRDTMVCELRLHTTWNSAQPLDSFVATLNEFEGLKFVDEHDTLFVESIAEEVEP